MRDNLDESLVLIFGHEGGYVNAATDAGGPTKYGITHKTLASYRGVSAVSAAQVQALTLSEAEAIYRKNYWPQSGGDLLPVGLDYGAFDFGINSGPPRAVKVLQKVLGFTGEQVDGWIGVETMKRVDQYPGGTAQLIRDYCDARMDYLRSLKNAKTGFPVNGRGWTIRVTGIDPLGKWAPQPGVIGNALKMAATAQRPAQATPQPAPPSPAPTAPPMPAEVASQATAKATPPPPNPWAKPEVYAPLMGGGTITAILTFLQTDPIKAALGIGILALVGIGAVFAFKRIKGASA